MLRLKKNNRCIRLAYDDIVTEELNGRYDLEFKLPLIDPEYQDTEDLNYRDIELLDIIIATVPGEKEQFFYVESIKKYKDHLTYYCKHVFFFLEKVVVKDLSINNATCNFAMKRLLSAISDKNDYTFSSDIQTKHTFNTKNKSVLDILCNGKHSILGQWGGVLVRDNYNISIKGRNGTDREELVAECKNIASFENDSNCESIVTRLYLTANVEKAELNVVVDSPLIDKYPRVFSQCRECNNESIKTVEDLRRHGNKIFENSSLDLPIDGFKITPTAEVNEMNLRIDDTCLLRLREYSTSRRIKVTRYTYSPMEEAYKSISFDRINTNLSTAINRSIENTKDEILAETELRIDRINKNIATIVKKEVANAEIRLDEELLKAEVNAKAKAYIKSAEGSADIINSITADVAWLKAVIVDAETIKAISAKIDIAKIKELLANTLYVKEIIQSTEFQHEINGVRTKLEQYVTTKNGELNSTIQTVNKKIEKEIEKTNSKINSEIEKTNSKITSEVEKTNSKITSEIEKTNTKINAEIEKKVNQINAEIEKTKADLQPEEKTLFNLIDNGNFKLIGTNKKGEPFPKGYSFPEVEGENKVSFVDGYIKVLGGSGDARLFIDIDPECNADHLWVYMQFEENYAQTSKFMTPRFVGERDGKLVNEAVFGSTARWEIENNILTFRIENSKFMQKKQISFQFYESGEKRIKEIGVYPSKEAIKVWLPSKNDIRDQNQVAVQSTEPTNKDLIWLNISQTPPELRVYNTKTSKWELANDIENKLDEAMSTISSSINQATDSITFAVSESYYNKASMDSKIAQIGNVMKITKEGINIDFNTKIDNINKTLNEANKDLLNINKYIRFVDGQIHIGNNDTKTNPQQIELRLLNDRISFMQKGLEVAYLSNNVLNITKGQFFESMNLGDFSFKIRENGNLSFKKVSR